MSLFLIGAGFNADAAAEVGSVYGNSFYDGRFLMNCAYPLVADVAHLCFELDQVPANKSIEQLFDDALAQRDYGPLKKLSYRLMEADYHLATRLSSSENSNCYREFFERFAGSNFMTFNYDSLPEIILHRAKRWHPHDGYGVSVKVEPFLRTADADNRDSTSLVLHLHGSFCVRTSETEMRRNPGDAISWLEPLALPRYSFDPNSISHCFPLYRKTMSSTGYVPIEERVIAPIPDKAQGLNQPFIKETYSKARSLVRESGTLIAVGYSFNSHDSASYRPILHALSESVDRSLVLVSPHASNLALEIRGAYHSLQVTPIDQTFKAWAGDSFRC